MIDEMNRATQNFDVLNCMKTNGFITKIEADSLGVARLSARIFDLRGMGIQIKTDYCYGKTRHGHPCRFARYTLI